MLASSELFRYPSCAALAALLLCAGCPSASPPATVRVVEGVPQATRYIPAEAYQHYLHARLALERGELDLAIQQLRQALALDQDSPYLHVALAQAKLKLGQQQPALRQLRQAVALDPGHPDALLALGSLLLRRGELKQAEQVLRRCVRHNPRRLPCYVQLAKLLEQREQRQQARRLLLRALHRLPVEQRPRGHRELGLLCLRAVDFGCGARELRLALASERPLETLLQLARVERALGHPSVAIRHLREAFDRTAANHAVAARLLELLHRSGKQQQVDDLLHVLQEAARSQPEQLRQVAELALTVDRAAWALRLLQHLTEPDINTRITRAVARYRAGERATARGELEALVAGRGGPTAALRLADLLTQANQHQQAAQLLARAGTQHPDSIPLATMRARALYNAGQQQASLALLRTAVRRRPGERGLRFALAAALERAGDWRGAVQQISQILAKRPHDAGSLNFLGYTLVQQGRELKRAERAIRHALRLRPAQGYILDSLGWLRHRQGQQQRARQLLQMALRLDPDEPEIMAHLAEVLAGLGQRTEATRLLRQALSKTRDKNLMAKLRRRLDQLLGERVGTR